MRVRFAREVAANGVVVDKSALLEKGPDVPPALVKAGSAEAPAAAPEAPADGPPRKFSWLRHRGGRERSCA